MRVPAMAVDSVFFGKEDRLNVCTIRFGSSSDHCHRVGT